MTICKHLSPNLAVRSQLGPAEIGGLAAQGFKGIINARPDDEEPGQPKSSELEAEANRHGLAYTHIPVIPGQATPDDGIRFAEAMRQSDGKVISFCRSGARAASLWELAGKPQ